MDIAKYQTIKSISLKKNEGVGSFYGLFRLTSRFDYDKLLDRLHQEDVAKKCLRFVVIPKRKAYESRA